MTDSHDTAAKHAKALGLKSLDIAVKLTGKPRQTLHNWYKNERDLFDVVIAGCIAKQAEASEGEQ